MLIEREVGSLLRLALGSDDLAAVLGAGYPEDFFRGREMPEEPGTTRMRRHRPDIGFFGRCDERRGATLFGVGASRIRVPRTRTEAAERRKALELRHCHEDLSASQSERRSPRHAFHGLRREK